MNTLETRPIRHLAPVSAGILAVTAMFGISSMSLAQTPAKAPSDQVTFAKDIAPILQRSCQTCHRPNNIAPMSLLTYQEVRPWAKSIKSQVLRREMPPWYIDHAVGIRDFKNDPSLTDQEITLISKWADAGAPLGNAADLPAPRTFDDSDRWHIGTPDIVVKLKKDLLVKAGQPDAWVDVSAEDLGLKTDRYIQAVEVKPIKGVKVVHHAVAQMAGSSDPDRPGSTGLLEEYAVGKFGDIYADGTGKQIKAGTEVTVNMHLHAVGEDTYANVAVALKLYPEGYVPKHVEISAHTGDEEDFEIPANTKNVRADGYTTLLKPARITAFQPHMHNRGQAQCMEIIYPATTSGGRSRKEMASCVDRYHFDWHIVYHYSEDAQPIVPAGTVLHIISLFDNTSGNKFNPDPSNPVAFGQRTIDDMSFAWVSYYYLSDEEYKQMSEERKSRTKKTTASNR
jgi:hypothetical protein